MSKDSVQNAPVKRRSPPVFRTLLCVALLGGLIGYIADRVYWNRYFSLFWSFATTGGQLENYDPSEAIKSVHTPLPRRPSAQAGIAPEALKAARDYAASTKASAFMVWHKGALVEETYFEGAKADGPIISRSLAKPFMAVAVGRAIALGKLKSLDQPVADFITEWKDDPARSKILIRHLLDNRTGLLAQQPVYGPFEIRNRSYLHPKHEKVLISEYPLTNAPGERYDYSQANGDYVAIVIERATGRRYAEFLSTEVFQPIGAHGGLIWINRPDGIAHSGCCMQIPAEDFLRLGVLLMQDGMWNEQRLLPEGYVQEMRTGTAQNPYAGLSVYVSGKYIERRGFANPDGQFADTKTLHSTPYLAKDLFLFDGNKHQVVYIVPSTQTVILRTGLRTPKEPEFDNVTLPNTILAGLNDGTPKPVPQVR
jgi:CubicO group peptidase (beta-lactamase class C family)